MALEAAVLAAGKAVATLVASRWLAGHAAQAEAAADLVDLVKVGFPDHHRAFG